MKATPLRMQSNHALTREISPVGRCRPAVRGFPRSKSRSTIRLKAIAQVRAQTIAARMRLKVLHPGHPRWARAATTIDASANGSANTVCESLTKLPHLNKPASGDVDRAQLDSEVIVLLTRWSSKSL